METKDNKLGQDPACPIDGILIDKFSQVDFNPMGMNKRFYAACAAMQAMLSNMTLIEIMTKKADLLEAHWSETLVSNAYILSDALLKQEGK